MAQLRILFTADIDRVGHILLSLAGAARDVQYEIVEEVPHGRNAPRGTGPDLMLELVRKRPGSHAAELFDAFAAAGRKRSGAPTALKHLVKTKKVRRKKVGPRIFKFEAVR